VKGNDANSEGNFNAGKWTDEEHNRFLEALQLYGKNWNKVHKHIGTRSSA
jgi:SHAQKYF class myb-like DNA-binding protein